MIYSINEPLYLHRDYQNDFNTESSILPPHPIAYRIVQLAAPLICCLYKPLSSATNAFFSSVRVLSSLQACGTNSSLRNIFNLAMSITAIAGVIFLRPVGVVVTSLHDISLNIQNIYKAIERGDGFEAFKQSGHLLNNTFYLVVMLQGSVEMQIISLAAQVFLGVISALQDCKIGDWLDDSVAAPSSTSPSKRAHIEPVQYPALGNRWNFPSDHLPIGIQVNGLKIVSWNVLNTCYLTRWTKKQGLDGSKITQFNNSKGIEGFGGVTYRDLQVIHHIVSMMDLSNDVINLQECGVPFLAALQQKLGSDWKMIQSKGDDGGKDFNVILYNSKRLVHNNEESNIFGSRINAHFKDINTDQEILVINTHVPGDPRLRGSDSIARHLRTIDKHPETTVVIGDFNFKPEVTTAALKSAGITEFTLLAPWPSNINPMTREPVAIDQAVVIGKDVHFRELSAKEILPAKSHLSESLDLLNGILEPARAGFEPDLIEVSA